MATDGLDKISHGLVKHHHLAYGSHKHLSLVLGACYLSVICQDTWLARLLPTKIDIPLEA